MLAAAIARLDILEVPVLVDRAFVWVCDDTGSVCLVLSSDVKTLLVVFHDAISNQTPLLLRLVGERHRANIFLHI